MTQMKRSWIESANSPDTDFPLNNLPYGVFSTGGTEPRCGIAIGDWIVDLARLEAENSVEVADKPCLQNAEWNTFMGLGPEMWASFRRSMTALLDADSQARSVVEPALVRRSEATLHMPFTVSEFTDFYSSRHHAFNVGSMFRGPENALPPNWLHIPIGYNGRASSVVVSGTDIRRPWGQIKGPNDDAPRFAPSERFDIELEMGAIVGTPSTGPISVAQADAHIFGYVLLNDWSARDIQAWEYQPLGPFQSKATATSISPWIVTAEALAPFRTATGTREEPLLPHLREPGPMLYDVDLRVELTPGGGDPVTICRTNASQMYYSSAQHLAHHTTSGCPMRVGDLLGSGTISGPERDSRGSLLELGWGGKDPLKLPNGATRSFIEDGDTLTLFGAAHGDGYRVGFGSCAGTVMPAASDPYSG